MIEFIKGRTKAVYYSIKGALYLIRTEHSIQAQLFFSICFILAGFYFDISKVKSQISLLFFSCTSVCINM